MVEIDLEVLKDQIASLGIDVDKLTPAFEKATNAAKNLGTVNFDKLGASLKDYISNLNSLSGNTSEKLRQGNLNNAKTFDTITNSLSKFIMLTTKFDAFKGLSVANGAAINTMGDQFDSLVKKFGGWGNASKALLGSGFSTIANLSEEGAKKLLENASSAQQLENAYINLQASTGQLGRIFDSHNKLLPSVTNDVARLGSTFTQTHLMTGKSTKEVAEFGAKLGTIPNVIGSVINVGQGFESGLEGLNATITLASGAGTDLTTVFNSMEKAYENLGNAQGKVTDNAQKGAAMLALASEASQKLGLRFTDTNGYLITVSDQFKMMGDNTQSATDILARFSGSLQNTGLTAKQSVEVVKDMVKSISNLTIGTKAFISARSGGPGGLQGAFQIDLLQQQGKSSEVLKMMEQNVRRQMGSRIYTLEDAASSPQAASQFMRQRSILQSSAFGAMASTPEAANHLMAAFKQGPVAIEKAMKDAATATKDVTEKGQELQRKQVNILGQMSSALDRSNALQELNALKNIRDTIGTTNPEFAKSFDASFKAAAADILQQYSVTKDGKQPEAMSLEAQQTTQNRLASADIIDAVPALGKGIMNLSGKVASSLTDTAMVLSNEMKANAQKQQNESFVKQETLKTQRAVGRSSMHMSVNEAMREGPNKLAAHIPKTTEIMKHEVSVKPLEVNIQVTRDQDTQIVTTTNYPSASIRHNVRQALNGIQEIQR